MDKPSQGMVDTIDMRAVDEDCRKSGEEATPAQVQVFVFDGWTFTPFRPVQAEAA
jgi:hypothetical protein